MKSIQKNNKGFTLLEIIIVIIIIGVLASLALPRFFRTVEYSRGSEALSHLSTIRQSMNRCYLGDNSYDGSGGSGVACQLNAGANSLDVELPDTDPRTHFTYVAAATSAATFSVTATRNAFENPGAAGDVITIDEAGAKTGTNVFSGIR